MKKFCYVDGKVVDSAKPQVKLNDLGLLRGYAVFDFIKIVKGRPLFWPEHLKRFRSSAKSLGLKVKLTDVEITKVVNQLLAKNKLTKSDASLRLILTGGESANGLQPNGKEVLVIILEEAYNLPAQIFKTGSKLIAIDYERSFPEAKTTNYLLAVSLQARKIKQKAVEILYVNNGKILEASTSNFFVVFGRKVITPKAGVLGGITREKIIHLAKQAGYRVEERDIKITEIKKATEAFITATNKDVCPIVKIDQQKIGNGRVGEVTEDLLNRYRALVEKQK